MSLSYIPYVSVDLLENLDLQTLNNTFEKLYINDLFYSEIDRIAPKVFINGATYNNGDCVWYNTEDPTEFVLSSNIHWRMIQAQVKKQGRESEYPNVAKYDLMTVLSNRICPNTVEYVKDGLDVTLWNSLSAQYLEALTCAYDIGNISDSVKIYQYTGPMAKLTIPTSEKFRYSDNVQLVDDPNVPISTYYLSTWVEVSTIVSGYTASGYFYSDISTSISCSGVTRKELKVPNMSVSKFYDANWTQLLNTSVKMEDVEAYVLAKLDEHMQNVSSDIYRQHTTNNISALSTFDHEYLDNNFSNIEDQVCQLNIPTLDNDDTDDTNIGFDYVYHMVVNGDKWFRLWKSGLLEHGGKVTMGDENFQSLSGVKINLNWTYEVPGNDDDVFTATTYTYSLNNADNTNTNVNQTANPFGSSSQYLLADDNRYQISYTWCTDDGSYYHPTLKKSDSYKLESDTIDFTECNVFNVKNTSFMIPNNAYLLDQTVEEGYVHHLHPTLYYYTYGFSRNINLNRYNKKSKVQIVQLSDCMLDSGFDYNLEYNGLPHTPKFTLTLDGIVKVDATEQTETQQGDYTVEYLNNVNVGVATIVITATSTSTWLRGSVEFNFNILPIPALKTEIELQEGPFYYGRTDIQPSLTVYYTNGNGESIEIPESDYTVSYANNFDVGTATAIVTFSGSNITEGTNSVSFEIEKLDISTCEIKYMNEKLSAYEEYSMYYMGQVIWPGIVIYTPEYDYYYEDNVILVNGDDYVIEHEASQEIGSYKLTVTGNNMCTGYVTVPYDIVQHPINDDKIRVGWTVSNSSSFSKQIISGKEMEGYGINDTTYVVTTVPSAKLYVMCGTTQLTLGKDYMISNGEGSKSVTGLSSHNNTDEVLEGLFIEGIGNFSESRSLPSNPTDSGSVESTIQFG